MLKKAIVFLLLMTASVHVVAQVHAQWRGEIRDGSYKVENLINSWPAEGPELVWTAEVEGVGYSSPSVTEDAIYITGLIDTLEYVSAYDLQGKLLWKSELGPGWTASFNASRSTPLVVDDKVYAVSGLGYIACFDRFSGKTIWKKDAIREYEGHYDIWGVAESLLYHDGKVIFTPCGNRTTMVAMDALTSNTAWESESFGDSSAYVSPILINYAGEDRIIGVSSNYIFSVSPENGRIHWRKTYSDILPPTGNADFPIQNTTSPLYHEGQIYVTSGYDHVGVMYSLNEDGSDAELIWTDSTLDVHHGGVVLVNGYIYGSNWLNNGNGNWACIDWESGETMYEEKWINKGSIIAVNERLFCYEERFGNIAMVEASPEGFHIISQFQPTQERGWRHWSHPVIHNGILYNRFKDQLRAYRIAATTEVQF